MKMIRKSSIFSYKGKFTNVSNVAEPILISIDSSSDFLSPLSGEPSLTKIVGSGGKSAKFSLIHH